MIGKIGVHRNHVRVTFITCGFPEFGPKALYEAGTLYQFIQWWVITLFILFCTLQNPFVFVDISRSLSFARRLL